MTKKNNSALNLMAASITVRIVGLAGQADIIPLDNESQGNYDLGVLFLSNILQISLLSATSLIFILLCGNFPN